MNYVVRDNNNRAVATRPGGKETVFGSLAEAVTFLHSMSVLLAGDSVCSGAGALPLRVEIVSSEQKNSSQPIII